VIAEQRVDMFISRLLIRAVKPQMFPVLDSRHQVDSEQVGQTEDRFAFYVDKSSFSLLPTPLSEGFAASIS